jgi:hypothetical protein
MPSVALDGRLHALEVPGEKHPRDLGIGRLPERGRANDVAEEHRHEFAPLPIARLKRGTALRAELEGLGGLVAADGTNDRV